MQRAKFGLIAIEAREHLERLRAQWEIMQKIERGINERNGLPRISDVDNVNGKALPKTFNIYLRD
jgi:hypothetical protein